MTPDHKAIVMASLPAPMTDAQFDEVFAGWETHPYGGDMGVALTKGTEFHFVPSKTFRFKRSLMAEQIKPLLDRFGFLTTRIQHGDTESQRINRLFGFAPTWSDDKFQFSIMTALPFKE